jgi:hypothetical protein
MILSRTSHLPLRLLIALGTAAALLLFAAAARGVSGLPMLPL